MLPRRLIMDTYHEPVEAIEPGPWEITEDDLTQSQSRVRALQIRRYEQIWNVVEDHLAGGRDDPRYLEIGIRVLKEEAVIYHLGKLQAPSEDEEDPHILAIDRMALVTKQLEDLEARRQAQEAEARRRAQGTTVQNPGEVPDLGPMDLGPDLGLDPGDPDAGR